MAVHLDVGTLNKKNMIRDNLIGLLMVLNIQISKILFHDTELKQKALSLSPRLFSLIIHSAYANDVCAEIRALLLFLSIKKKKRKHQTSL